MRAVNASLCKPDIAPSETQSRGIHHAHKHYQGTQQIPSKACTAKTTIQT